MDKTAVKWYNSLMNDIIFVGTYAEAIEKKLNINSLYKFVCCKNQGDIVWADNTCAYKRGEVLLIPPLIKYRVTSKMDECLCVLMDKVLLSSRKIFVISGDMAGTITLNCNAALAFIGKDACITQAYGQLLVALSASYIGGNGLPPLIVSIMEDVEKNLSNPTYSPEIFMRTLPFNYDYLRKLFKNKTSLTPHDYLLMCRMELAKNIIDSGISNRYSNYSISQIAEMCGYTEPLYFSKVFKKYFGISPTEYKGE
jgi:AraC-like DNA-binding protein